MDLLFETRDVPIWQLLLLALGTAHGIAQLVAFLYVRHRGFHFPWE